MQPSYEFLPPQGTAPAETFVATMPTHPLALSILALALMPACARGPAAPTTSAPSPASSQCVTAAEPRDDATETPTRTPPADAERTTSGLASIVLAPGTGTERPSRGARIRAHYIGWTASDLAMFDDSYDRGEPIEFQAEDVIKGWGEIVGAMVVGERRRVWIPEALAYEGKAGMPGGTLIFDIELLAFEPAANGG